VQEGEIDRGAAKASLDNLRMLGIERHAHEPLLERVWALLDSLTAYDAVYVALPEALDAILLTCDGKLARAPGLGKRIEYVGG
jgi:predicted nucleic acid-binding protein